MNQFQSIFLTAACLAQQPGITRGAILPAAPSVIKNILTHSYTGRKYRQPQLPSYQHQMDRLEAALPVLWKLMHPLPVTIFNF